MARHSTQKLPHSNFHAASLKAGEKEPWKRLGNIWKMKTKSGLALNQFGKRNYTK